eukprot:5116596-Amphidinium_carterae.1
MTAALEMRRVLKRRGRATAVLLPNSLTSLSCKLTIGSRATATQCGDPRSAPARASGIHF